MHTRQKEPATGNKAIVHTLKQLLNGGNAHVSIEKALENIPAGIRGEVPAGLPYSLWQLAEHIRIAQWDILEFCKHASHLSPEWPDEYWPKETTPASNTQWEKTIKAISDDRKSFLQLLEAPDADLYTPFEHADDGQNLLREALLIADHTAYHTGEIIVLRRLLDNWD